MYWPFKTITPSQREIFCYCGFVICIGLSWPQQPSQSEILSVIVAWSYVLAFHDPNTLPKWNIFCYCSLIVCIGLSSTITPSQREIFSVIVALIIWVGLFRTTTHSHSEIFSVIVAWSYVLAFQYQKTLRKWNIFCYCSLIVCIGLWGP